MIALFCIEMYFFVWYNIFKVIKMKKKLIFTAVSGISILLLIIISILIINLYIFFSTSDMLTDSDGARWLDADCILVFGAGVKPDGTPSNMLKDRLDKAVELYNDGICDKIIMSGDHGTREYDEVNVMKQYAVDSGIPSENIFMDHAGFSTYESLYRTIKIFEAERVILVTQRYHQYRALYIASELGLKARGVETDYRKYGGELYRNIREAIARCKDFAYACVKPKPTFLGDTIPVSGNGDITND